MQTVEELKKEADKARDNLRAFAMEQHLTLVLDMCQRQIFNTIAESPRNIGNAVQSAVTAAYLEGLLIGAAGDSLPDHPLYNYAQRIIPLARSVRQAFDKWFRAKQAKPTT